MDGEWISLAERSELLEPAYAFGEEEPGAEFMRYDSAGALATSIRIAKLWPHYLLALVAADRTVVARAVSVPFNSEVAGREELPDSGWDGVVQWAVEDSLDERQPTTACALEVAVAPRWRGCGLSASGIDALRRVAFGQGMRELVAPVRPPDKAAEPFTWLPQPPGVALLPRAAPYRDRH